MCLYSVTSTKVLDHDLEVFKVVNYDKKSKHSFFGIFCHKERVKKGLNFAKIITNIKTNNGYSIYESGFHCFEDSDSAVIFAYSTVFDCKKYKLKVRKFVIPEGTKVTIGIQGILSFSEEKPKTLYPVCIVTPVLINIGE